MLNKLSSQTLRSLRDPDGANLDRIQVIKGWIDSEGKTHERVFDVTCSDERTINQSRCNGDVGNTVDIASASYKNTIGESYLVGHWSDPEFDSNQDAFYYVRVIEIPTPRWTAYDALRFNVKMPDNVVMEHQERAYTSPIWYSK